MSEGFIKNIRSFPIKDRWTVHSYYTLNPYAPDGSGRILCAGCDLSSGRGEVMILDSDGRVIDRFGEQRVSTIFFHTGFWQSWGRDAKYVYYQSSDGAPAKPYVTVRELSSGHEERVDADMEGTPVYGEPFLYGLSGMYYASGYADGKYHPEQSPIPFGDRARHGLFSASPLSGRRELLLSVNDILAVHPLRERILHEDKKYDGGLTLMVYCARFSRDGRHVMFHFGNHCTDRQRKEPHLLNLFTADFDPEGGISKLSHALDMSFERGGVHWSWDNEGGLLGYYRENGESCLARINADGSDFRAVSRVKFTGGHPSVSPKDRRLIVTDGAFGEQGRLMLLKDGEVFDTLELPKVNRAHGDIPRGRNRFYVCHHPVFSESGDRLLCNTLPGGNAVLCELELDYRALDR